MVKKIFLLGYILSLSLLHGIQPNNLVLLTKDTTFDEVRHLCQATPTNPTMDIIAQGKKHNQSSSSSVSFIIQPLKNTLRPCEWRYTKNINRVMDDGNTKSFLELTWLQDQEAFNEIKINKFHSDDTSYPLMKIKFTPNSNAVPITQTNQPKNYISMTQDDIRNAFINKVNELQAYLIEYVNNKDLYFSLHIQTLKNHINDIHQKTLERCFQSLLPEAPVTHCNNLALIFTGYFQEITDNILNMINNNLSTIENANRDIAFALASSSLSPEEKVHLFFNITDEALNNIEALFNSLTLTPISPDSCSRLFNKILHHSITDEIFNLEDNANKIIEFHNYFSLLELDEKDYCKLLNSYLFNEEVFNILNHLIANCNENEAPIWKLLLKNNILRSKFLNSVILKAQKENIITEDNINEEFIKIYDFIDTICNIASNINISSFIIDCLCAYPSLIIPFLQKGNGFDFQNYNLIVQKINSCFIKKDNDEIIINPIILVALQGNIETIINALQENNQAISAWLTPEFYTYLLETYFELSGLKTENENVNAKIKSNFNITPLVQWFFQNQKDIEARYAFLNDLIYHRNLTEYTINFAEYAINNVELLNFMMETNPDTILNITNNLSFILGDIIPNCNATLTESSSLYYNNDLTENEIQALDLEIIDIINNELKNYNDDWFNAFYDNFSTFINPKYKNLLRNELLNIMQYEAIYHLTFDIRVKNIPSAISKKLNNNNEFDYAIDPTTPHQPIQEEEIINIINENPWWGKRFLNCCIHCCNFFWEHRAPILSTIGAIGALIGGVHYYKNNELNTHHSQHVTKCIMPQNPIPLIPF